MATYRLMLLQAACLVCLAHGSNDVVNSIAPLLIELQVKDYSSGWAFYLGAFGIVIGLIAMGRCVMETVGEGVIKLDYQRAFSCQVATAACVVIGTSFGYPLSTTHCMVGSLFGILVCQKLKIGQRLQQSQGIELARQQQLASDTLDQSTQHSTRDTTQPETEIPG